MSAPDMSAHGPAPSPVRSLKTGGARPNTGGMNARSLGWLLEALLVGCLIWAAAGVAFAQ